MPDPWYRYGGAPEPVGAYQSYGVASRAASLINLANPGTHDLVAATGGAADGTLPAWDTHGPWMFNGVQALNTGIVPGPDYSAIIRFSQQTNQSYALFGSDAHDDGADWEIDVINGLGVFWAWGMGNQNTLSDWAGGMSEGVLALTPAKGWKNGALIAQKAYDWVGSNIFPILIGGKTHHYQGPSTLCVGGVWEFAVWSVDISDYVPGMSSHLLESAAPWRYPVKFRAYF